MASKKNGYNASVLFASSAGGYRKKDVNDYIVRVDAEHAEQISELEEKISQGETALEDALRRIEEKSEEISALEENISKLNKQLEDERSSSAEALARERRSSDDALAQSRALAESQLLSAQSRQSELESEIKALRETVDSLELELADTKKHLSDALAELALAEAYAASRVTADDECIITQVELEELRKKAAMYDELGASLGGSLANATIAANNLLVAARAEADGIRREAEAELELTREAIRRSAVEAVDDICKIISSATVGELDTILRELDEAKTSASTVKESISQKSWESRATVAYIKAVLEAEIGKRISLIGYAPETSTVEALDGTEAVRNEAIASAIVDGGESSPSEEEEAFDDTVPTEECGDGALEPETQITAEPTSEAECACVQNASPKEKVVVPSSTIRRVSNPQKRTISLLGMLLPRGRKVTKSKRGR